MDTGARRVSTTVARREFLTRLSLTMIGSVAALAQAGRAAAVPPAPATSLFPPLPTIRLGEHSVTRLIAGSNPISGYSDMGPILDRHMKEYFAFAHIKPTDGVIVGMYPRYQDQIQENAQYTRQFGAET